MFCYYKEEEANKEAAVQTVSERNKRCVCRGGGWGGGGVRERREKEKGKRIESSRDDR